MTSILPIETIAEATDKWIQDVVRHHFQDDEIHFVEIKRRQNNSRDGFLSETLFLDVIMSGRDLLALVVKLAPLDEGMKSLLLDGKLAEAEMTFYKIMNSPDFKARLKTLDVVPPLPVVLYCEMVNRVFTLVMENLSSATVQLSSPSPGDSADLELTTLAIESIATMHAVGYAYIERHGVTALGILCKRNVAYELNMSSLFESGLNMALAETKISDKRILHSLRRLQSSRDYSLFFDDTETAMQPTICHGDYWIGQTMYSKSAKKLSVIDWQFAQLCNPVYDIVSFLALSSDITVYRNHMEEIVQAYTSKLKESLEKLKCSLEVSHDQVLTSVNKALRLGAI